jgi:hypothetical protein
MTQTSNEDLHYQELNSQEGNMVSIQAQSKVHRSRNDVSGKLDSLVRQGKRLGVLGADGGDFLEDFREELTDDGGQYVAVDLSLIEEKSFVESLLTALKSVRSSRHRPTNLPLPSSSSPFIHRAITWQRLCDHLIEEEEPHRPTLLVVKNFDQADERTRCDLERLIRFHDTHNIRRTFLLTLQNEDADTLRPSLQRLIDLQIESVTQGA